MQGYLTLVPLDPVTRYFYPDGTVLDISSSLAQTVANIQALDRREVEGYLGFLAYAARMYRVVAPIAILGEPPTFRSVLHIPPPEMLRVDFWRTMDGAIRSHVRSPYLRQLFDRFATYLGANPYHALALYNVIAHVELTAGLWYPKGGTYAIARAYHALAQELGVEIRTGARVARILVERGAATGVILDNGTVERAAAVVSNVDVARACRDLLPPEVLTPQRRARFSEGTFSCSGFVMLLGVQGHWPQLTHHNILFSSDYRREFGQIFQQGIPPQEPTVYIAVTSKTDPDHAPADGENWFVMVNVPPLGPQWDWAREAGGYRQRVLERLAGCGLDVRGRIRAERVLTPVELERMTGAWRGALYGLSFNNPLAPFVRPHNRAPGVRGLYFAGGTAHPGGGVPLVTLSGGVAAKMLLHDTGG